MAAPARDAARDTDADWRELGATKPYWGVITHPDYEPDALTAERKAAFHAWGADHVADTVRRFQALFGAAPAGAALDFGCGVGRLTEPMSRHAREVVGYDISPGMLEQARARGGNAAYTDRLPDGPFDWINSFIVFQHIPPDRGMALIEALLDRLAPGGFLSLHVTVWREPQLVPHTPKGWRLALSPLVPRWRPPPAPTGTIMMYDYDLGAVVACLNRHGVEQMTLISTDHGGHHGVVIYARRPAAAAPQPSALKEAS